MNFRIVGATEAGLSEGRQSRVSILEYERAGQTHQVLWKRMGAGKGLDEGEATSFNARLRPYRQSLARAGWRLPKLLYTRVAELPDEHQILAYEQFIAGGDGEKLLASPAEPNFRKWFLMSEVVRRLYDYPEDQLNRTNVSGREVTRLPHGLDLKLANVVLEAGTNEMYFVDLFGPKELDARGQWLSYSPKLDTLPPANLMAVTATREGALLRCWRLAERHWADGYKAPEELRADFMAALSELSLPADELSLVRSEVEAGYPWLDKLYRETVV
ncbi:MAG: hypothetical protein ACR2HY_04840 [Acidimicrobiales bacterium]